MKLLLFNTETITKKTSLFGSNTTSRLKIYGNKKKKNNCSGQNNYNVNVNTYKCSRKDDKK